MVVTSTIPAPALFDFSVNPDHIALLVQSGECVLRLDTDSMLTFTRVTFYWCLKVEVEHFGVIVQSLM